MNGSVLVKAEKNFEKSWMLTDRVEVSARTSRTVPVDKSVLNKMELLRTHWRLQWLRVIILIPRWCTSWFVVRR